MGEDGTAHKKGNKGPKKLSIFAGDDGKHFIKVDETSEDSTKLELLNAAINAIPAQLHNEDKNVVITFLKDHSYHKEIGMARLHYIYFESESQAQGFVEVYNMYQQMDNRSDAGSDAGSDASSESSYDGGATTQDWPDYSIVNLDERKALVSSGTSSNSNSSSPEPVEFGIGGQTANSSSNVSSEQEDDHVNGDLSEKLNKLNEKFWELSNGSKYKSQK